MLDGDNTPHPTKMGQLFPPPNMLGGRKTGCNHPVGTPPPMGVGGGGGGVCVVPVNPLTPSTTPSFPSEQKTNQSPPTAPTKKQLAGVPPPSPGGCCFGEGENRPFYPALVLLAQNTTPPPRVSGGPSLGGKTPVLGDTCSPQGVWGGEPSWFPSVVGKTTP